MTGYLGRPFKSALNLSVGQMCEAKCIIDDVYSMSAPELKT